MKNSIFFLCLVSSILIVACKSNTNSGSKNTSEETTTTSSIDGEQLFKINCNQCHKANENFNGPALKDAASRWTDKTLLYEFVKNSQQVIAKDAYAKALFTKWNETVMQPFPQITNNEIDAILNYCNTATE
jgi:cytochrome c551/c552